MFDPQTAAAFAKADAVGDVTTDNLRRELARFRTTLETIAAHEWPDSDSPIEAVRKAFELRQIARDAPSAEGSGKEGE